VQKFALNFPFFFAGAEIWGLNVHHFKTLKGFKVDPKESLRNQQSEQHRFPGYAYFNVYIVYLLNKCDKFRDFSISSSL
jgi:hypothetical protein